MTEIREERRKSVRFKVKQPVSLTVLGGIANPVMEACIMDISAGGLRLRVPERLPVGTPVKVDTQDILMLAEVVRCESDGGAYTVGMEVHGSVAASDLMKLNDALLQEDFRIIQQQSSQLAQLLSKAVDHVSAAGAAALV
jgi:hypothetical protein